MSEIRLTMFFNIPIFEGLVASDRSYLEQKTEPVLPLRFRTTETLQNPSFVVICLAKAVEFGSAMRSPAWLTEG